MITSEIRQAVLLRAGNRCEYCRLKQEHYRLWRHQIEHIIPVKHFGSDSLSNLALACVRCNLGKSSNLSGLDPLSDEITPLYNPRKQEWHEHFVYAGSWISGLTPEGRVTVYVLNMNEPQRLRLRYHLWDNGELD